MRTTSSSRTSISRTGGCNPHVDAEAQQRLAGYYRAALERAETLARANPYRLSTPLVWCSTNDVVAVATQAVLLRAHDRRTGRFRPLAAEARDWVFGRNPWGVSFVIGCAGGRLREPAASHVAQARGQAAGRRPRRWAVYKDINDGLKYAAFGEDALAHFQSAAGVYHDCFADFSTNEPTIDGTVGLLVLWRYGDPDQFKHARPHAGRGKRRSRALRSRMPLAYLPLSSATNGLMSRNPPPRPRLTSPFVNGQAGYAVCQPAGRTGPARMG